MHPLTAIYCEADSLMRNREVGKINQRIEEIVHQEPDTDVLLAWLTATLPIKTKLTARPSLFKLAKRLIKQRGEWERGILSGLK